MYNNVDKLENVIFSAGYFSVIHTVMLGLKDKNGNRLNSVKDYEFNSQKYNDLSKLRRLTFDFASDYLVLSFKGMVDGVFAISEIYVSYPHLQDFNNYLYSLLETLNSNPTQYFTDTGTVEGTPQYFESEPLAGGKTLIAQPYKIKRNSEAGVYYVNGVALFINDRTVQLDLNALYNLVIRLNYFNLSTESLIMKMGYMQLDSGSSSGNQPRSNSALPPRSNMNNKPSGNNTTKFNNTQNPNLSRPKPNNQTTNAVPDTTQETPLDNNTETVTSEDTGTAEYSTTANDLLKQIANGTNDVDVQGLLDSLEE